MLQGVKVRLVPPKKEYIDRFQKWMNDPEITQYLRIFRPITREMEEEWFNTMIKSKNDILFSIVVHDDENNEILIGNCDIDVDWKNRVGNVGIVIGEKEHHGKGFGTETMKLLVNYAWKMGQ